MTQFLSTAAPNVSANPGAPGATIIHWTLSMGGLSPPSSAVSWLFRGRGNTIKFVEPRPIIHLSQIRRMWTPINQKDLKGLV